VYLGWARQELRTESREGIVILKNVSVGSKWQKKK
jgi:hypothetical protein